jgi:lipase
VPDLRDELEVPVEGGTLRVGAAGAPPDGAPLVLAAHGITSNRFAWGPIARLLGDDVRLLVPDLRGRGSSAGVEGPFGIAAHAADLVAVLDRLGAPDAVVAGHSMGAYVAAWLAATRPERVRSLVLVDGGLALPVAGEADPDEVLDALLGPAIARLRQTFPSRDAYRDFWRRHPAFADADVEERDLAAYADQDLIGTEPELRPAAREDAVRADGRDMYVNEEVRTALERVDRPGILLRAPRGLLNDANAFIPAERAASFAHPTVRLAQVEDVNHYTITLGAAGARAVADAIRQAAV